MSASFEDMANSFGKAADVYDSSRPTYPLEALTWLVPSEARTVLDLGAGTGKFTKLLVDAGFVTIAVEPSHEMLARLSANLPPVDARIGTAENIPLESGSVDAVVAAQSWHWVDAAKALPEVARVLRSGGTFSMVWNMRDQSVDWVAALGAAMHESEAEARFERVATVTAPFGTLETATFEWSMPVTRESLKDLVSSRSYFITATDEVKTGVLAAVDRVLDEHPDLRGLTEYELPYVTYCFRSRRA